MSVGTRLCVPRLADPVAHRPRLTKLLAHGARLPVTLVSGPPGAGKTTLLASWLRSVDDRPTAWLSVDGRDDEQERLAELIVEALVQAGALAAGAGEWMGSLAGHQLLDAAFEQVMETGTSCVLVVEDVQELRGRELELL